MSGESVSRDIAQGVVRVWQEIYRETEDDLQKALGFLRILTLASDWHDMGGHCMKCVICGVVISKTGDHARHCGTGELLKKYGIEK